jgi:putative intracellular protease/amidase
MAQNDDISDRSRTKPRQPVDRRMHVLIVTTSQDRLGNAGGKTGVCLESFVTGYYACLDAGFDVTVCSPLGGAVPIDPLSDDRQAVCAIVQRFNADPAARADLSDALMLSEICAADFGAAYYCDGRGALWDLATNPDSRSLIAQLQRWGRPCAFAGHGAAALLPLRSPDGAPLVAGRRLTAPKREEDAALGLPASAPSLETGLTALGACYVAGPNGMPHLVQDGGWITGQNAASSDAVARALISAVSLGAFEKL